MMKIYLYLISFILCSYFGECAQPYFPSQIVFSFENSDAIIAIDEINQRAHQSFPVYSSTKTQKSFGIKQFPYAPPDSPQSKHYVQLLIDSDDKCAFSTYWEYGGNYFNLFPNHWLVNKNSFEIKNYLNFTSKMIHSTNSSSDEDYWYANDTCQIESGETYPCQEIYFIKNTDIPLRLSEVVYRGYRFVRRTTNYKIISIGKPDDKYFTSIPKNWYNLCEDNDLGLVHYPEVVKIKLHQTAKVHVSLSAPPHRIHGNDTVRVLWNTTQCIDCFTLSPNQFTFNINNFDKQQILTITRLKDAPQVAIIPILYGGGFSVLPPQRFSVYIE